MTELITSRLSIRPIDISDAPAIQAAASEIAISDTMISVPHPYPDGEAERYIKHCFSKQEKIISLVISHKSRNQFLGLIEVREIDREHSQAELSFWLCTGVWGKGYMNEALQAVISYCFIDLGLNRLYAYHMVRNPASGRVLKRNGFIQEGLLRQRVKKWGIFEDVILQALLRDEWQKSR